MTINNRRNLVFRVSIVINVAVLLYVAMHITTTTTPSMEWVPVSGEEGERALDIEYMTASYLRNYSSDSETTSHKITSTVATLNKTLISTTTSNATYSTVSEESLNKINRAAPYYTDDGEDEGSSIFSDNLLTDQALARVHNLVQCSQRSFDYEVRQRGEFWTLVNYVPAQHGSILCYETVTYTTHAGYEFLDNVPPLVERWNAPISLAIYAPGTDFPRALDSIRYLRDCSGPVSELIKKYVTFHIFFPNKHIPAKVLNPEDFLSLPFKCNATPAWKNVKSTYMKEHSLLYPVNVARNLAREAALTHFVLPSDIELYPSVDVVPKFLNMIARNKKPLDSKLPRVFVLSIFEVDEKHSIPPTKTVLQAMLKNKTAIPFHKFVCPTCHNIPMKDKWIATKESKRMDVFHVGKRQGKFGHWEPIYIGTHKDPYYDERLSWDGKADKMTQGFALCVLNYEFMILNDGFLTHKPGIKKYKQDKKRNLISGKQSHFIKTVIMPELKKLYGDRKGCTAL